MRQRAKLSDGDHIDFEVFGESGPFVFLGPQVYLTPPAPDLDAMRDGYVASLRDRYRVILADWPRGVGNSSPAKGPTLHRDQAILDIHAIADAARAERFAWWGYSFGAAVGLQLARNNPRISAFVCAGFPPLWQPLSDMLGSTRGMARMGAPKLMQNVTSRWGDFAGMNRQSVAFYESVAGNDDWEAIKEIKCPSMVLHDVDDTVELMGLKNDLSMRTRVVEEDLKKLGWDVVWIDTGLAHMAMRDTKACAAAFGPFLDRVLLGRTSTA